MPGGLLVIDETGRDELSEPMRFQPSATVMVSEVIGEPLNVSIVAEENFSQYPIPTFNSFFMMYPLPLYAKALLACVGKRLETVSFPILTGSEIKFHRERTSTTTFTGGNVNVESAPVVVPATFIALTR